MCPGPYGQGGGWRVDHVPPQLSACGMAAASPRDVIDLAPYESGVKDTPWPAAWGAEPASGVVSTYLTS